MASVCAQVLCCVWLLWPHGLYPTRLPCPWDFPGKNIGVGCHFLFQGIFLTQGSHLHLLHVLHWQADSLPLSHLGSHTHRNNNHNQKFYIYYQHVFQGQVSLVLRLTHRETARYALHKTVDLNLGLYTSAQHAVFDNWILVWISSLFSSHCLFPPAFRLPVTLPHIFCIFMPSFLYLNSFLWAYKTIQSSKSLLLSFPQAPPSQMNDFFIFLPVAAWQYSLYYLVHTSGRVALIVVYLLIYLWLPILKTLGTHTKKSLTFCRDCVFSNFISPVHWGCIELYT